MTENAGAEATATDAAGSTDQGQQPQQPEVDWKAKAREWERRAKDNKSAADRLAEIEQAQKSAEQKATEAQQAAERRATEAESRALRLEVAHEKGLTPAQAKRLIGGTREEIEADADEILRDFNVAAQTASADQGVRAGAVADSGQDMNFLLRRAAGRA